MSHKLHEIQTKLRALNLKTDSKNPHFKNQYLSLPGLLEEITPLLEEEGLYLVQELTAIGPVPALRTQLIDETMSDGTAYQEIVYLSDQTVPLILDRQSPQAVGSAITYYRRYSILTLFNLVAEADDDGEKSVERPVRNAKSSSNTKSKAI